MIRCLTVFNFWTVKAMRRVTFALFLFCLMPVIALAEMTAKQHTLRFDAHPQIFKVYMDLSGPVKQRNFSLSKPDRFVVDLLDVKREGQTPKLNFSNTPIKKIRAGVRKNNGLRLVFDLSQAVKARAYVVSVPNGSRYRLVVEITGFTPPAKVNANTIVRSSTVLPVTAPVVPLKSVEKPRAVNRGLASVRRPLRDIVIAIDAGHGGIDPGARGHGGTREKDVVLAIARRLEALVRKEPGMRPVMIREGDEYLRLRQRVEKAQMHHADLLLSIHADAFDDRRVRGASVYTLSHNGATNEAARLLADRENAVDYIDFLDETTDDVLASVLIDLSQNAMIESSMDVASRVLDGIRRITPLHKRKIEQAGFMVLKSPDIPSILVETAFISNAQDEKNLLSVNHQKKMAKAMMSGIRSYFKLKPPMGTRIAAHEHVIRRGDTLSKIARKYDVSLKMLRTANRLKGDRLLVGRVLQIPLNGS